MKETFDLVSGCELPVVVVLAWDSMESVLDIKMLWSN